MQHEQVFLHINYVNIESEKYHEGLCFPRPAPALHSYTPNCMSTASLMECHGEILLCVIAGLFQGKHTP